MRIGSLFSGYGGLDMAVMDTLGGDLAWYSEIEPAACTILAAHYPGVPNLGDITTVDWATVPPVDVLTGGYPCQPFSHAGQRKGKNDERHLWPYVCAAIDALRPGLVVLENVRGHLTLGFGDVLADLSRVGYDARWGVVRASDAGAPHGRARIFITAHPPRPGRERAAPLSDGPVRAERLGHAESGAGESSPAYAGRGPLAGTGAAGDGLPVAAERGDGSPADADDADGEAWGDAGHDGARVRVEPVGHPALAPNADRDGYGGGAGLRRNGRTGSRP